MKNKTVKKDRSSAKNPVGQKVWKVVLLPLSENEIAKKDKELRTLVLELTVVELEKKEIMKTLQDRINGFDEKIKALAKATSEGKVEQKIEATMVKDQERRIVEYWYQGSMVESRPWQDEDNQEELALAEIKLKKEAKAKSALKAMQKAKKQGAEIDLENVTDEASKEAAEVIRQETNKKTKRSSVDPVMQVVKGGA